MTKQELVEKKVVLEQEMAEIEAGGKFPSLLRSKDLLGISVDIVAGEERDTCRHCGRDYTEDNMEEAEKGNDPLYLCPSDDCPGYIARHAIALAEGK